MRGLRLEKKVHLAVRVFIVIALGHLLFWVNVVNAITASPSKASLVELDTWMTTYLKENNTPGAVIAVASQGELVHVKAYGLANVELAVPVSKETVFEIGSVSKQFTSAAAMLMVEEGKLKLNAAIHTYLPFLPSEWMGVTVHQLLTHTSGIPDYEEIRSYDIYRHRLTPQDVIKIAQSRPMDFPPGTGWYYSNTGYYLLSMILENIDGLPLGKILNKRIFLPLGMTQTRMADPEAIIGNRAAGYWVNKRNELINRNPTETSSTLGAGGLLSSASDMAKWDGALYDERLLSAESKTKMWTVASNFDGTETDYAYGWVLSDIEGLRSVSHRGLVAGFGTNFIRLLDEKLTVIVFINRYWVSTKPIAKKIIHTFVPRVVPK